MIDMFSDGLSTAPVVFTISFQLMDTYCDTPLCMASALEIHFPRRQMQEFPV